MEVLIITKEELINNFRSADMMYAQACKQPDPNVVVAAQQLRNNIGHVIIEKFNIDPDDLNHFVYALN